MNFPPTPGCDAGFRHYHLRKLHLTWLSCITWSQTVVKGYMAEALRALAAGGDIVISGLNSSGLRNQIINRRKKVPALKLDRVCKFLKSQSFNIEQCLLMGLGGFSRPAPKATWHGLGLPFADRVVIHGHHQSNITNARVLRFRQIKSTGRTSAALDGCSSREAAS